MGIVRSNAGWGKRPAEGFDIHGPILPSSIRSMTSLTFAIGAATSICPSNVVPVQRHPATFDEPLRTMLLPWPITSCVLSAATADKLQQKIAMTAMQTRAFMDQAFPTIQRNVTFTSGPVLMVPSIAVGGLMP